VEKGIVKSEENHFEFTRNIEFSSPSLAASIVRGGNSNGLTSWKNGKGKTLKEVENNLKLYFDFPILVQNAYSARYKGNKICDYLRYLFP
jgi:Domain of unknown function (DUF4357)